MKRTPKKKKVFRFAAAVVTFAALVMWSGCEGANKPGGSSQTGNSDGGNGTIVNNGGSGGGNTGGVTPPSASADKTYMLGGVSFTMKGIAAVTNGMVGHDDTNDNKPHKVSLSAYRIGETEVTQELWQAVMGNNPSFYDNRGMKSKYGKDFDTAPADGEEQTKRPVENVTWFQCIAFCNELTKKLTGLGADECVYYLKDDGTTVYTKDHANAGKKPVQKLDKKGFRLPTEAEWEWAAKGGTEYKWAGTNDKSKLGEYAWYSDNSGDKTHEVGKKLPNRYGLYDMSGNVSEWCWDWHSNTTPAGGQDSEGAASGSNRVSRGGSWPPDESYAARAYRDKCGPGSCDYDLGLRLACRP